MASIERTTGGRLGVLAYEPATGRTLAYRADERFVMCSTFKVLAAAAILAEVHLGRLDLDQSVAYGPNDLLAYAPITAAHVQDGRMKLGDLCAAAVELSDNTAANLLLGLIGGPAGLTTWLRREGDAVTRLDRTETALNTSKVGDPRDTTTPRAMVKTLDHLLFGKGLASGGQAMLLSWMLAAKTGQDRLRAGAPPGWREGDKTGTWSWSPTRGTANDVAAFFRGPANVRPIFVAAYLMDATVEAAARDRALAQVGAAVGEAFTRG